LGQKTKKMLNFGQDIHQEVRSHARLLDQLEAGMVRNRGLLATGMTRISLLAEGGLSSRNACLLIVLIVAVFFIVYYWLSRRNV